MATVTFNEQRCRGCALCVEACPKKLISMSAERINLKGFHPATVADSKDCTGCAFCATMCPHVVIEVER